MALKVVNSVPASELKGRPVGRALVKLGKLTREEYHVGLSAQKSTHAGKRLGEILVELGKVSQLDVQVALAGNYGFDFVDLAGVELPPDVVQGLQASTANAYKVVPVEHDPDAQSITVAIRDRDQYRVVDDLKNVLGFKTVRCVVADGAQIDALIAKHYGGKTLAEAGKRIPRRPRAARARASTSPRWPTPPATTRSSSS